MTSPVLLDNTVLANFALVKRTDLVTRLWGQAVCVTPSTLAEHLAGVAKGMSPPDSWPGLATVTLTQEEDALANSLGSRLGTGERTSLAVALHRQGLFASDDRDARKAARELGVTVTGTLGILVACVRKDYLSLEQADTLLAAMTTAGYRSPVASLAPLVNQL